MKVSKTPKKKTSNRKISLRAVRLEGVKFTSQAKASTMPSIPVPPESL